MIVYVHKSKYTLKIRGNSNFIKKKHKYIRSSKSSALPSADKSHFQVKKKKKDDRTGLTLKMYVNISGHLLSCSVGSD